MEQDGQGDDQPADRPDPEVGGPDIQPMDQ